MTGSPLVIALDEQAVRSVITEHWAALALVVLKAEGVAEHSELNLTFIDVDEMTRLNEQYMDGTGPTDVLSFPLDDDDSTMFFGQTRLLGDVLICPEVVAKQAKAGLDAEMALMVVHGVLHILGMDHQDEVEAVEMRAAEQRHLRAWAEVGSGVSS